MHAHCSYSFLWEKLSIQTQNSIFHFLHSPNEWSNLGFVLGVVFCDACLFGIEMHSRQIQEFKINIPENCDCSHLVITISLCKEEVMRAGCCSAAVSLSFKINWGFCANYFSCTALCFVPPSSLHLSSHCSVTPSSQMWAALAWGRRAHVDSNLASL